MTQRPDEARRLAFGTVFDLVRRIRAISDEERQEILMTMIQLLDGGRVRVTRDLAVSDERRRLAVRRST